MKQFRLYLFLACLFILACAAKNFGPDPTPLETLFIVVAFITYILLVPFGPLATYYGFSRKHFLGFILGGASLLLQFFTLYLLFDLELPTWSIALFIVFVVLSCITAFLGWKKRNRL